MKPRFVVPAFGALLFVALFSVAKEPRRSPQPGKPVTLESYGFELRATLPQGWSLTAEEGFVLPPDLAASCRVRGGFYTDRNWDRFLVSALRPSDRLLTSEDARVVLKMAGHPAVSNRYLREAVRVRDIYINLSDLQLDSGAVWTVESNLTPEGSDCEHKFVTMIQSATITRVTSTP